MYLAVAAVLDRLLNGPFLLEVFSELPLESLENVIYLFIINTKSLGRYLIRSMVTDVTNLQPLPINK